MEKKQVIMLSGAVLLGLGGAIGFRLFHAAGATADSAPTEAAPRAVASAPNVPSPETFAVPGASQVAALEKAALAAPLDAAEADLMKSADANAWERKLKLATIAARHGGQISNGESLGLAYLQAMMKEPREAMQAIASLIKKLPVAEFAVDRAALMDVAAQLPGQETEVRKLAREELKTVVAEAKPDPSTATTQEELNKILTTDPAGTVAVVAHGAILKTQKNADEVLSDTIEALRAQRDTTVRNQIAGQDVAKYPQHEQPLVNELNALGTKVLFNRKQAPANQIASIDKRTTDSLDQTVIDKGKAMADQHAAQGGATTVTTNDDAPAGIDVKNDPSTLQKAEAK